MHAGGTEVHTSSPNASGQYMLRTYRDSHGVTYTAAWRRDIWDTWGPEHVLYPVPATEVAS